MKINLEELALKQRKLDNYIYQNSQLTSQNTLKKRIFALLVEVGETANELRFFKFWTKKPPGDKEIILEEFIDIIHFIISIGNTINLSLWEIETDRSNEDLIDLFMNLYEQILLFSKANNEGQFKNMLLSLFIILEKLNYSKEDIVAMYYLKNKINFERQNNNY
ncbi:MAG: dUTP diphosphatase [Mycoplasmataceae bacterium]|nr:dUTP diphosphatase [Mycoplasmataceae bacterium]